MLALFTFLIAFAAHAKDETFIVNIQPTGEIVMYRMPDESGCHIHASGDALSPEEVPAMRARVRRVLIGAEFLVDDFLDARPKRADGTPDFTVGEFMKFLKRLERKLACAPAVADYIQTVSDLEVRSRHMAPTIYLQTRAGAKSALIDACL